MDSSYFYNVLQLNNGHYGHTLHLIWSTETVIFVGPLFAMPPHFPERDLSFVGREPFHSSSSKFRRRQCLCLMPMLGKGGLRCTVFCYCVVS